MHHTNPDLEETNATKHKCRTLPPYKATYQWPARCVDSRQGGTRGRRHRPTIEWQYRNRTLLSHHDTQNATRILIIIKASKVDCTLQQIRGTLEWRLTTNVTTIAVPSWRWQLRDFKYALDNALSCIRNHDPTPIRTPRKNNTFPIPNLTYTDATR
jgi:hypothetical protein